MTEGTPLPRMVQFALADVQAHSHLARVEQASRMWHDAAACLSELSDSLRGELECIQPFWTDATGDGFTRRIVRHKAAIDELLTRIEEHQPWRALDDLARQLLLTRAKSTEAVERATDESHQVAAAHLAELDRYFLAAARAVFAAAGGDEAGPPTTLAATNQAHTGECCSGPGSGGPVLANGPGVGPALLSALEPEGGSPLPRGGVSVPGLLAVPPVSGTGGRFPPRQATEVAGGSPGAAFDPRTFAGGSLPESGVSGSYGASSDSSPDPGGPDTPPRIEQAADPVPLTEQQATPSAPRPPESHTGTSSGTAGGGVPGRMVPPMMMMPTAPGAGRGSAGGGAARSPGGGERRTRTTPATTGVPARLRGRSALADPTGRGFRPVAMSATRNTTEESAARETLDHEVWEVGNPAAATPLKPDTAETDQPRKLRRPRL